MKIEIDTKYGRYSDDLYHLFIDHYKSYSTFEITRPIMFEVTTRDSFGREYIQSKSELSITLNSKNKN